MDVARCTPIVCLFSERIASCISATAMERDLMIKIEHKGFRIWAILQTSGEYRAFFIKPPVAGDAMADVSPLIEGETQAEAIDKARKFLDGMPELQRSAQDVQHGIPDAGVQVAKG